MNNRDIRENNSLKGLNFDEYEIIIVGAGIGGLVCGCYLAKAGIKVLIIEKNSTIGGYCTSFELNKFKFDAGVHGIGGMHPRGATFKLINDLSLDTKFDSKDPVESLYFANKYLINFWRDIKKTQKELIDAFPNEKVGLCEFINFILNKSSLEIFGAYRNKSFSDFLDSFFRNSDLKKILGIPLGNIGLSSRICSAQAGITFYREFLLNTHTYPEGGMQTFSNSLRNKFISYKGELVLNTHIIKIEKEHDKYLIFSSDGGLFVSKMLILNIDLMQTLDIMQDNNVIHWLKKIITPQRFSNSAFFINIGFSKKIEFNFRGVKISNFWFFPKDDTSKVFLDNDRKDYRSCFNSKSIFFSIPTSTTMRLLILAPFLDITYWKNYKQQMFDNLSARAEYILGNFRQHQEVSSISTPQDLFKYTFNYKGACYGWVATKYLKSTFTRFLKFDDKLFFCGHWVPNIFGSGGISNVIHSAYLCSNYILKKRKQ